MNPNFLDLTHYQNLTMIQVCEHYSILYELDMRLLIFNNILIVIMKAVNHIRNMVSVLTDLHTVVT